MERNCWAVTAQKAPPMEVRPFGRRCRGGFTLVEMLVVISIIGLLIAILMPVLSRARESARDAMCKNNLRQIGVALTAHAESKGLLCTGAMDWQRDGCVTEVGWVADLVNRGTPVGQMLCPTNPLKLTSAYDALQTFDAASDNCVERLGTLPGTYPDGSPKINACRQIAALAPLTEPRRLLVEQLVFDKFYNTNYVASWFLVRSEVRLDSSGNLLTAGGCPSTLIDRVGTIGPLHAARINSNTAPGTRIPLLACGGPTKAAAEFLPQDVGPYHQGMQLAASMTDGPVDPITIQAPSFNIPTPYSGAAGWWRTWNKTLQDYRGFNPVHGTSCNVLFADGHVAALVDANGDGYLNNGFNPAMALIKTGFTDATLELHEGDVYSGWSLSPETKKTK